MAFRRFNREGGNGHPGPGYEDGGVATREREPAGPPAHEGRHTTDDAATLRAHEARDRFGGINWGAAFFGLLAAVGMAAILTALLSAAGAAIGLTEGSTAEDNAETVSIVGGALLILALAIAYYCGGYVAGRMSRFDGKRQGAGVWAIGLVITIAIAVAGAIFGSEYNVLNQLNLPRIPIDEGDLATGGAIALVLTLLATLFAAIAGGAKGRHYHDRVDRAAGRDW